MFIKITNGDGGKRFIATIYEDYQGLKPMARIKFGAANGSTYIDHQDDIKKKNYIARHSKLNENWDEISAGSLSRYLLWEKKTLEDAKKFYEKKFGIKFI